MRVRFIAPGNWRGMGFNPGAEVTMDAATAQAYCRAGQCELLANEPTPAAETREAAAIAAKPEIDRPGAPVETAASPRRERRTKK